jgi:uncharacterized protein YjbI with pentapeptide repeats
MTNDRLRDHLAAVRALPADDGPRLALAAAFEAAGDDLGAFVRMQVERSRREARRGQPRPRPSPAERRLRDGAAARWLELLPELRPLAKAPRKLELVRGLPGRLRIEWSDLEAQGEDRFRSIPLQHLDLVGSRAVGQLDRLLAWPGLAQLLSLSLRGAGLADVEGSALATADLGSLRWLDLRDNAIGEAGVESLVASRRLPRLVVADFLGNESNPIEIPLYEEDLGGNAVVYSRHGRRAPDESGSTWDDYVQETIWSDLAGRLEQRHGMRPWLHVLWRAKREIPHRLNVWSGLADERLDGQDLAGAVFLASEILRTTARAASFRGANLAASRIDTCDLEGADLRGASLLRAAVTASRFRDARATGASFDHCRIVDCDFSSADLSEARFDGAQVADTSFRQARLVCADDVRAEGRTRNARFIRCDFRGCDFSGRELHDTQFIDCKFAGVTGAPVPLGTVHVERPDFSPAGDGTDVRSPDHLYAAWHLSSRETL